MQIAYVSTTMMKGALAKGSLCCLSLKARVRNGCALACTAFAHEEVKLVVMLPVIHELMSSFDAKSRKINH